MPELRVEQYCALGEFAYQFGNLERWVNSGIMEASDSSDPNALPLGFEDRVKELKKVLLGLPHLVTLTESSFNFGEAINLGRRRNTLLHGEPLSLLRISEADSEGRVEFEGKHVNLYTRHGEHVELDSPTLKAMANEARNLADRLSGVVLNLAAAKREHGLNTIVIGFGGNPR